MQQVLSEKEVQALNELGHKGASSSVSIPDIMDAILEVKKTAVIQMHSYGDEWQTLVTGIMERKVFTGLHKEPLLSLYQAYCSVLEDAK